MLQYKAQNAFGIGCDDNKGPGTVPLLNAGTGTQSVRLAHLDWGCMYPSGLSDDYTAYQDAWVDPNIRSLPSGSTVTRCITVTIPTFATNGKDYYPYSDFRRDDWGYALAPAGLRPGATPTDQYLQVTPWDIWYSYNYLDIYPSSVVADATSMGPNYGQGVDDHLGGPLSNRGIYFLTGPRCWFTSRGANKIRNALYQAKHLLRHKGIETEFEIGNELNMATRRIETDFVNSYPEILGVGFMPDGYASLFYEICKIASESSGPYGSFLKFGSGRNTRIKIFSGGFSQYLGMGGGTYYTRSVCYKQDYYGHTRNPFHPDSGNTYRQEPDSPDRRFVWEWLDRYYYLVNSWDGAPSAYPGEYGDNPRTGTSVIDRLDGLGLHCYISGGHGSYYINTRDPNTGQDTTIYQGVSSTDGYSCRQAFRLLVNHFLSLAAVRGQENNPNYPTDPRAQYPAYYENLSCYVTEFGYPGMSAASYAKDAYYWTVTYYNSYSGLPWSRLKRIYHFSTADNDKLAHLQNCGTYPSGVTYEIPAGYDSGSYHQGLWFHN